MRRNSLIADLLHRHQAYARHGPRAGCPEPAFTENGFFAAVFFPNPEVRAQIVAPSPEVTGEVTGEVLRLLEAMKGEMKRLEMQAALGLKHEEHFRKAYLLPALKLGGVEMTLPEKPRSSKQRYRITQRGTEFLKQSPAAPEVPGE
ncbi:MAG TPA: hypothetical protein VKK31_31230 [Thermoanaerobaculia bacterium]|nr:hypothetical protein [Thermoanaerobaculia bacterium]